MAENNNLSENNMNVPNEVVNKPLLNSFLKYFTNTPSNRLRSVNFGKSLFRYFLPDLPEKEIPTDPATLLDATYSLFTIGFHDHDITDDAFVRFMIDKINKEPDLITPDMLVDLIKSDAYQKFGQNKTDLNTKQKFERWIYEKSMLSKIDLVQPVDIVEYQESLTWIVNSIVPGQKNKDKYLKQINHKVDEFKDTYVNHVDEESFSYLHHIAQNSKADYAQRLKRIYSVLCDDASYINDMIDAIHTGANIKDRSTVLTGLGIATNKILSGVAKCKGWSKQDFEKIYLPFPIEERAAKFEQKAQLHSQQNNHVEEDKFATVDDFQFENSRQDNNTEEDKFTTVDDFQSEDSEIKQKPKQFNYGFDVAKTFGITLGGATAISAISSIPAVGQFIGPILAVSTVAQAGITAIRTAVKEAKEKGKLGKKETVALAAKTAGAVLLKMGPYAASMAFGMKGRVIGSGVVFAKTLFSDMERRAKLQNNQLQQAKPKGFKNALRYLGEIGRTIRGKGFIKAAGYAAAKSAAMFLGGMAGSKLGTFAGSKFVNGIVDHNVPNDQIEETAQTSNELQSETLNSTNNTDSQSQINDDNLQRLSKIGQVELTDNARATTYVENDRQYIGGVQQDWYTANEQQTALETLRNAGVEDPVGVLRKMGSASRFFGGEYQNTLDNLCAGKISDEDVNQIFSALNKINAEGGLGKIETLTPTPVPPGTEVYQTPASSNVQSVPSAPEYQSELVEDEFTSIPVPPGTEAYRTPETTLVKKSISNLKKPTQFVPEYMQPEPIEDDLSAIPVPPGSEKYRAPESKIEAQDYLTVSPSDLNNHLTNTNKVTSQSNSTAFPSGANNYTYSNVQDNDFTADADEPALLSNDQLARLRASWLSSGELSQEEVRNYLSELNDEELSSTLDLIDTQAIDSETTATIRKAVDEEFKERIELAKIDEKYYQKRIDAINHVENLMALDDSAARMEYISSHNINNEELSAINRELNSMSASSQMQPTAKLANISTPLPIDNYRTDLGIEH